MNVKKSVKTKKSIPEIQALKNKRPIVCLTSYTTPIAEIANKYADIILVGDSLGMVLYGYKDTLPVTLDMMIQHGKAVVKSAPNTSVLVDLPFGSYEYNDKIAFDTSVKIMKFEVLSAPGGLPHPPHYVRNDVRHVFVSQEKNIFL